jgi:hypothetical protein
MRLERIQIGNVIELDPLGRRFHALVAGNLRRPIDPARWTGASPTACAAPVT